METTQKNREEAAKAPARKTEAPRPKKAAPEGEHRRTAPPASAQQSNGAARTAQEQKRAARPRPAGEEQEKRPANSRPRPAQAPKKQASAQKAAAPDRKRPSSAPVKTAQKKAKPPQEVYERKRAYGRSKPKKKPAMVAFAQSVKQKARQMAVKNAKKGSKSGNSQQNAPAVIYTQPQAFNRSRFLIQLLTVTAIVAAMVMGMSVFFKVKNITVSGAEVYTSYKIMEASGIKEGDNLLSFGQIRAGAQIKANLPYVKTVRFGIKLPDTVNIIVEEEDVVYAIKNQDGIWWLMSADGRMVEQTSSAKAANYTKILGVTLDNPIKNQQAIAVEAVAATDEAGEVIPVTVTGSQRLNAVLRILKALEANGIVGEAASVDVTRMEDIVLWYGSRYQGNLGDSSNLEYKVASMNDAILQLSEYESGVLDVSFTVWADKVIYTPFS